MIGNFARLHRTPSRAPAADEPHDDAPPERFVEKISDEGGDVYLSPLVESLRASLRARRRESDASPAAPEPPTVRERTEARP